MCFENIVKYGQDTKVDFDALNVPKTRDYTTHRCVRPKFSQQNDTCWAVSSSGAAEISHCLHAKDDSKKRLNFSPKFLSDCSKVQFGQSSSLVDPVYFSWVLQNGFCPMAEYIEKFDEKQNVGDVQVKRNKCKGCENPVKPKRIFNFSCAGPEIWVRALDLFGPMMASVGANNNEFTQDVKEDARDDFPATLARNTQASTLSMNHAVIMMGYMEHPTEKNLPLFLLKNSFTGDIYDSGLLALRYGSLDLHLLAVAFDFRDETAEVPEWASPYLLKELSRETVKGYEVNSMYKYEMSPEELDKMHKIMIGEMEAPTF